MKLKLFACALVISTASTGYSYAFENTNKQQNSTVMSTKLQKKTDDRIATSLIILNNNEIKMAQMAERKSQDKNVIGFAQWMIREHSHNLKETEQLMKKLNLTAVKGKVSHQLMQKGKAGSKKLAPLTGHAFDLAYMHAMVKDHMGALQLIDKFITLTPNPRMQKFLKATRVHVNKHLQKAQAILNKL